ncbi:MAG: alkaline phosphatase family protein [Candidatus Nealsonbacteria bacterium]|nr:alkaline phosphatase family protein [Candidatus Nealsonbacteria bacterium]
MNHPKIIVFGIDGGTWILLKPLAERGDLPAFKKIMDSGSYGTLMSSIPCRSSTSIISFYTGKNPGKWGGLDFSCFDCDVVRYDKIRERSQAIWETLGKYGLKSAILNLPTTYPPTPIEGVMLSGFSMSEKDDYTYPKEFKEMVRGFHSERETFLKLISGQQTMENENELFNLYLRTAKQRYQIIKDIIRNKDFNFSMFWIDESDALQHDFWGKGSYLLTFFKEIDKNLQDIMENNPDSNLIIMSDHGFDAVPIYEFYPKTWLEKEGYLKMKGTIIHRFAAKLANSLIIRLPSNYRYKYIGFIFYMLKKIKGLAIKRKKAENQPIKVERNWRLKKHSSESKAIGVDWSKTMAVNHDFWGIKIIKENLNRNYEELRSEIIGKMKELRDKNGEKIIKYVWKREEIFHGQDVSKFPDIAYLPASKFLPTGFLPFSITKKIKIPRGVRVSTGGHMIIREGIFLAVGPNIKKTGDIGELNVLDLAPTILSVFGIPVPADMDGRILKEIIQ